MHYPTSRNNPDGTRLVVALAFVLTAMALPAAVQAGPSRDVGDALHGRADTDRVALDRIERLAGLDVENDVLDVRPWSPTGHSSRPASSETREAVTFDAYPWQTLTRSRDVSRAQERDGRERDGRERGEARGRHDGRGREDRDGRGGHDRDDDRDDRGGHHGHHAHGDRDDFELDEHGHGVGDGEGHFHGSDTPVSAVPVPAAAWLLGLGLLGLVGARRRKVMGAPAGAAAA